MDNLKSINKTIEEALEEYEARARLPFEREISIKHPDQDAGMHIREDGVVEIWTGDVKLILDGQNGIFLVDAPHVINHSTDTNFLNKANGFGINSSPINEAFYNYKTGDKEVLLPLKPESLDVEFITGMPQQGQQLVSFKTIMKKRALFLPPKKTSEQLLELLKRANLG